MNGPAIAGVLGKLLLIVGGSMLLPAAVAASHGEGDLRALLGGAALPLGLGAPLAVRFRRHVELATQDAVVVAVFGWIAISALTAVPFVVHGAIPSFTDAFFEMMSGYTTTGATILADIEAVPHGLLFLRSQTHLLGGMGFLTLLVLVEPGAMSGLRLFRAESSPGQVITKERFLPRTRDLMIWLWGIYLALTALNTVLLALGGMPLFDAVCHAFGTVSTSGYSPKNASMGHYGSAWFDWVTIVFMVLGGVSFLAFHHAVVGNLRVIRGNTELRWYAGFLVALCGAVAWLLHHHDAYGASDAVRHGTFQVVSLLTTTGFTTVDYEGWPQAAQMFLIPACFIGACAGSTTSGIKVVHYVILWKYCVASVKKLFFQPLAVVSVRLDGHSVQAAAVALAVCYFAANALIVVGGGCVMVLLDDLDAISAMSAVTASLMNIGPGWGEVGPTQNFSGLSAPAKWFLSWTMLVGRLEMFTALVVLYPSFWRR